MANQEHLDILKQGIGVWNRWRLERENRLEQPNLSRANLRRAKLEGADLTNVNLSRAELQGANLEGAHLDKANLYWTNLEGANLRRASLKEANLSWTNLSGAYLDGANLQYAEISNTENVGPWIVDVHWGDSNLTIMRWSLVRMLGEEYEARQVMARKGRRRQEAISFLQEMYSFRVSRSDFSFTGHIIEDDIVERAVRANRQLAIALRNQGLNEEGDRFAYQALRLKRILYRRELVHYISLHEAVKNLGSYIFSWFLDLLAGYGYHPAKTFFWYLLVIFGFALAYSTFGHLPLFPDAFVFSTMSFHGRGFFPSLNFVIGLHHPLVVFAALEAVVGLFIEISFIATFTQRFFGK